MRVSLRCTALTALLLLVSCGGAERDDAGAVPDASSGQVASGGPVYPLSHYAASRFAEQASFGPTPALVTEIRTQGFEKWIDAQFALAPSTLDAKPVEDYIDPVPDSQWVYWQNGVQQLLMTAPDQLRLRTTWSLSQFITTSTRKGDVAGAVHWLNMLQKQAFGGYADMLYQVSVSPYMAQYLDNDQNRPKSAECPFCAPNENFARELMQLFTLGVFKLNPDGTPMRNSKGGYVETYSQQDVEQLARVLTGWQHNPEPQNRPNRNWANWGKPMVPSSWPPERDSGEKRVLGKTFPAGQSAPKDLQDTIALLMGHPNIAPFVSLRLIQHLVKSNPTPAYVGRVAAKFRNNGSGAAGDMKAVIKAVLLDAEARAGDNPASVRSDDGKFREPALHRAALYRALGCQRAPTGRRWPGYMLNTQPHFAPNSVFSYYAPTDRAPGSNLLSPEQKLVNATELVGRFGELNWLRWDDATRTNSLMNYSDAGCQIEALSRAFASSPRAFNDYLSQRFFRGAMPPTLRSNIEQLMRGDPFWDRNAPDDGALRLLGYALATPYYGVIK
ncbi:DUF1800 domain-containing protein [Aquabacterium sp.]|uniref:DUF1800 domain-containing protein n=1 Tax=Aquabacterium sp. TaxID=1872578 RepID=UPI002BEF2447|nr:DUF1800 family protein [Aquabacterium sp.]HSW03350.1 DUF1800 family protein [Aquabacterium sp.]